MGSKHTPLQQPNLRPPKRILLQISLPIQPLPNNTTITRTRMIDLHLQRRSLHQPEIRQSRGIILGRLGLDDLIPEHINRLLHHIISHGLLGSLSMPINPHPHTPMDELARILQRLVIHLLPIFIADAIIPPRRPIDRRNGLRPLEHPIHQTRIIQLPKPPRPHRLPGRLHIILGIEVLHPVQIRRIEAQDAAGLAVGVLELGDHPGEAGVGLSGVVVGAADVGVRAGEPALLEVGEVVCGLGLFPDGGDEEVAVLVEGEGVECVLDASGDFLVDEGVGFYVLFAEIYGDAEGAWGSVG